MKTLYFYIGGTAAAVLLSAVMAWFIFASTPQGSAPSTSVPYGSASDNASTVTTSLAGTGSAPDASSGQAGSVNSTDVPASVSTQKVFKLSDGPVAGATFVQTQNPTTTIARFVMADNGHAFDLPVDVQGAVPKPLSNTTIPGAQSAQWAQGSAILQYLDGSTPKTVYLGLSAPNATSSASRLKFYPDGIVSLAVSPDGMKAAYLLRTASGVDGYVSAADGSGATKLFSLPLKEVQLRWPAPKTLLAYSSAAADVPGIAFAIDAKSGVATPLLSAQGLTAMADGSFAHILYQTASASGRSSWDHDLVSGGDRALSFSPFPEQCVGSPLSASVLLCAVPLSYVAGDFIDGWHQGTASAADSLVVYDLRTGESGLLATPGQDGGVGTDMLQLAVSPDGRYALFVSKYDRSLWGVRLF